MLFPPSLSFFFFFFFHVCYFGCFSLFLCFCVCVCDQKNLFSSAGTNSVVFGPFLYVGKVPPSILLCRPFPKFSNLISIDLFFWSMSTQVYVFILSTSQIALTSVICCIMARKILFSTYFAKVFFLLFSPSLSFFFFFFFFSCVLFWMFFFVFVFLCEWEMDEWGIERLR